MNSPVSPSVLCWLSPSMALYIQAQPMALMTEGSDSVRVIAPMQCEPRLSMSAGQTRRRRPAAAAAPSDTEGAERLLKAAARSGGLSTALHDSIRACGRAK